MEESKILSFEKKKVCCNPYSWHTSTKNTTLRSVTPADLETLIQNGVKWVTVKMKLCSNCRQQCKIAENSAAHQQESQTSCQNDTSTSLQSTSSSALSNCQKQCKIPGNSAVYQPERSPQTSQQNDTSPSPQSTPSSAASIKKIDNLEAINSIGSILKVELPRRSLLDPESSNYRGATSEKIYNQMQSKLKSIFPPHVTAVSDDFHQVNKLTFPF